MARREGESERGERTRERILETSLQLFRTHGFDETTMRDIAKEADMSLGAAYYYFESKEALVLAYYEKVHAERRRRALEVFQRTQDLGERVRALYQLHLDIVKRDRKLLGALVRSVADPSSTLSVFADATRATRQGSLALFREAVSVPEVPEALRDLGAIALWTLDLALMLYLTWDDSPRQERTRKLADDTVSMVLPIVPLLASPLAAPLRTRFERVLTEAGLLVRAEGPK
jgi:AcrR family transcriptional regulator